MSVSLLAICVLGFIGALADVALVPVATAFFALAWVQPRASDNVLTGALGVGLTPLIAWFAGRADEYAREGVIAAALIVTIIAVLASLRRRGNLAETSIRT